MPAYKAPCPACREKGRDRSGDNLTVFPEGNTFCNACGYKGFISDKPEVVMPVDTETLKDISSLPIGSDPSRVIPDEVAKLYGTRVSYDTMKGEIDAVYYPYFNDGEITGYKKRQLGVPKKRAFTVVGSISGLFGHNPEAKGHGNLLITEGEEDAMAARAMLDIGLPAECDVVSLPNGASLDKTTTAELDWIKGYRTVYVCLDADSVGREAADKVGSWLTQSVKTKIVTLDPKIGKDASDYYLLGNHREFKHAIKHSKEYIPEGMLSISDIDFSDLLEPEPEGIPTGYKGIDEALHGLRKGEIVTLCAESGIGKTTFSRELAKSLLEQDQGVAIIALETQLKMTVKSLLALDMNMPLSDFIFRPPTMSECQPSIDKLKSGGEAYFYKHKGGIDNPTLLATIASYARSRKVDFIVLDHLHIALAGTDNSRMGEAKAIDMLMNKLHSLVVETNVGLILISHIKRSDGDVGEDGRVIKLTDLRGSAAIEQYSDAVLALERQQQAEEEEENNKVRVRLLKSRLFGRTGIVDRLLYIPSTGRLINAPRPAPIALPPLEEIKTDVETP